METGEMRPADIYQRKEQILPKRFTATEKWRKGFMKGLSTVHKLLWLYVLDECDHAGIWDVELEVASIRIGEDVANAKVSDFNGKVIEIDEGRKWFVLDFITFQYGRLNDKVNAHKSAIDRLSSQLPEDQLQQFINPSQGVKDKDKVKVKDKDKDKGKGGLGAEDLRLRNDIEEILDLFETKVKSRSIDKSGSLKVKRKTLGTVMESGVTKETLLEAVGNYATACHADDPKFRKGAQSFFGPKFQAWRDYVGSSWRGSEGNSGLSPTERLARDTAGKFDHLD